MASTLTTCIRIYGSLVLYLSVDTILNTRFDHQDPWVALRLSVSGFLLASVLTHGIYCLHLSLRHRCAKHYHSNFIDPHDSRDTGKKHFLTDEPAEYIERGHKPRPVNVEYKCHERRFDDRDNVNLWWSATAASGNDDSDSTIRYSTSSIHTNRLHDIFGKPAGPRTTPSRPNSPAESPPRFLDDSDYDVTAPGHFESDFHSKAACEVVTINAVILQHVLRMASANMTSEEQEQIRGQGVDCHTELSHGASGLEDSVTPTTAGLGTGTWCRAWNSSRVAPR